MQLQIKILNFDEEKSPEQEVSNAQKTARGGEMVGPRGSVDFLQNLMTFSHRINAQQLPVSFFYV